MEGAGEQEKGSSKMCRISPQDKREKSSEKVCEIEKQ